MEDDKRSFYDILMANSKLKENEKEKNLTATNTDKLVVFIAAIIVFAIDSSILWLGWNHAISPVFDIKTITYIQAVLFIAVVKTILKIFSK